MEPRIRRNGPAPLGVARLRARLSSTSGGASVHSRVLSSIVAVTACAVLVFTLPLAVATARIYREGAVARLQRDAVWTAAGLSGGRTGVPARLPWPYPGSHGIQYSGADCRPAS